MSLKGEFDLCVVGAGMIGSSAARHASRDPGIRVCLIGPKEPEKRRIDDDRNIYGAHYDEGRITRLADPDPVWAALAQKSIARYRQLEQESGVRFYSESGMLMVGTKGNTFISNVKETNRTQGIKSQNLDGKALADKFPFLNLSDDDEGYFQNEDAGCISPRGFVNAQQVLALKQGCSIIDDVANCVTRTVQSDGTYAMKISTDSGKIVFAKKVLLATGAFTSFRYLLPEIQPAIGLCPLTVALVEVSDTRVQELRNFTPVIYSGKGADNLHAQFPRSPDGSVSYYMVPPVKYPDGKYYIKLGHFHASISTRMQTAEEVKRWYCEGNPQLAEDTARFIYSLVKGIDRKSYHGDYCVISETETERPYIDMVHSQLGVALGGNGYAAKSSDEIGRIATAMMMGTWDSDIPRETFHLRLKQAQANKTLAKL